MNDTLLTSRRSGEASDLDLVLSHARMATLYDNHGNTLRGNILKCKHASPKNGDLSEIYRMSELFLELKTAGVKYGGGVVGDMISPLEWFCRKSVTAASLPNTDRTLRP